MLKRDANVEFRILGGVENKQIALQQGLEQCERAVEEGERPNKMVSFEVFTA